VRRILHKDLNFHPFKIIATQELSDLDMAKRNAIAERLIGILSYLMTREAHFHLFACGNKPIFRYGAEENPQQLHQRPHHGARVTV
jgi:hypothetical protein